MEQSLPKIRGVPHDAIKLDANEVRRILDPLAGVWYIESIGTDRAAQLAVSGMQRPSVLYEEACFENNDLVLSGGTHEMRRKRGSITVPNEPWRQPVNLMYRDQRGSIYLDFMGSLLDQPCDPESGSITVNNFMGAKMRFTRVKQQAAAPALGQLQMGSSLSPNGTWTAVADPISGDTYYHNTATGETTWDHAVAGFPPPPPRRNYNVMTL